MPTEVQTVFVLFGFAFVLITVGTFAAFTAGFNFQAVLVLRYDEEQQPLYGDNSIEIHCDTYSLWGGVLIALASALFGAHCFATTTSWQLEAFGTLTLSLIVNAGAAALGIAIGVLIRGYRQEKVEKLALELLHDLSFDEAGQPIEPGALIVLEEDSPEDIAYLAMRSQDRKFVYPVLGYASPHTGGRNPYAKRTPLEFLFGYVEDDNPCEDCVGGDCSSCEHSHSDQ